MPTLREVLFAGTADRETAAAVYEACDRGGLFRETLATGVSTNACEQVQSLVLAAVLCPAADPDEVARLSVAHRLRRALRVQDVPVRGLRRVLRGFGTDLHGRSCYRMLKILSRTAAGRRYLEDPGRPVPPALLVHLESIPWAHRAGHLARLHLLPGAAVARAAEAGELGRLVATATALADVDPSLRGAADALLARAAERGSRSRSRLLEILAEDAAVRGDWAQPPLRSTADVVVLRSLSDFRRYGRLLRNCWARDEMRPRMMMRACTGERVFAAVRLSRRPERWCAVELRPWLTGWVVAQSRGEANAGLDGAEDQRLRALIEASLDAGERLADPAVYELASGADADLFDGLEDLGDEVEDDPEDGIDEEPMPVRRAA